MKELVFTGILLGTLACLPRVIRARDVRCFSVWRIDKKRLHLEYDTAYKVAFVSLFHPTRIGLDLNDGHFDTGAQEPTETVLIIELRANPPGLGPQRSGSIFFRSILSAVLDRETFRILWYRKRVQERISLLVFRSRKDYEEIVRYEGAEGSLRAVLQRKDYREGTHTQREIRLHSEYTSGGPSDRGIWNLPGLLGNVLFRPGYLQDLQRRTRPVESRMITQGGLYRFRMHVMPDRARSPLTGRVRATRVVTDVKLQSLGGEIAPFTVWFANPMELPGWLAELCRSAGLFAFPVAMELDLSLGSLRVMAKRATAYAPGSSE